MSIVVYKSNINVIKNWFGHYDMKQYQACMSDGGGGGGENLGG